MLVLAGPGTGKTTTLVEAIVDRIEQRGAGPDEVLALTFSRKAAEQLRDRVTARLGRTSTTTLSSTFHSFAYGLVRTYTPAGVYDGPLRLLSAPEADVVMRELLTDHPESVAWPESLARAVGTRGFAREVQAVLGRARDNGLDDRGLVAMGRDEGAPELVAAGLFMQQYLDNLDAQSAIDYSDLIRRATALAGEHRAELRARFTHVFVDEYQDTDPGQVALLRELAGDGRNLTVVGDPHQSIYGFRGAEVRGILEFPTTFPAADGSPRPRWWRCARPAGSGRGCCWPPSASPAASPCPAPSRRRRAPTSPPRWPSPVRTATAGSRCSPSTPSVPRPSTWPTCCVAPTSRTASRGTTWRSWSARAARPSPGCGARSAAPGCPSRWRATTSRSCVTPPPCRCSTRCGPSSTSTTRTPTTSTSSTPRGRRRCCSARSPASTPVSCAGSAGC